MNKNELKESYTSASTFPIKLIQSDAVELGYIDPYHLQLNITNVCNFKCKFCSCDNRDRKDILPLDKIKKIADKFYLYGCKAVTCTGGGEFLSHPNVNEVFKYLNDLRMNIGVVTNGSMIDRISKENLKNIRWIRISSSDYLLENLRRIGMTVEEWFKKISKIKGPDLAFSYVLSSEPDYEMIKDIVRFANKHKFTHVRIVSDLLDLKNVKMEEVKKELRGIDKLVIYQDRQEFTKGAKRCLVSLLKPVVAPDGLLYPCCGIQYAEKKPSRNYGKNMSMGKATDIDKIISKQKYYDGSKCVKCYYSDYNNCLELMTKPIKHRDFV